MPEKNITDLYNVLSKDFNMIPLPEFSTMIQDSAKARRVYDILSKKYKMIKFDDFRNNLRIKPLEPTGLIAKPLTEEVLPTITPKVEEGLLPPIKTTGLIPKSVTAEPVTTKVGITPPKIKIKIPEKFYLPPVPPGEGELITTKYGLMRKPTEKIFRPGEPTKPTPKTLAQKIKEVVYKPFKETPKEADARIRNIYSISKSYGLPISYVRKNYNDLSREIAKGVFGAELTTREKLDVAITPVMAAAIVANPISAALGIGTFMAVSEAENLIVSKVSKEPYKILAGKEFVDLLPEDVNRLTRGTLEVIEILAKMLIAGKVYKTTVPAVNRFTDKFTRDIITTYKIPKKLYISPEKVADIFRTGKEISPQETSLIAGLGLSGKQYRNAFKRGISIEVPVEKIVTITDKPYYAKLKSLFKLEPYKEVKVFREGKPIGREPIKGLLGEKIPDIIKEPAKEIIPERITEVPKLKLEFGKKGWEETPSDAEDIWHERMELVESIREKNKPRIEELKKEHETLRSNRDKTSVSRKKEIKNEIEKIRDEAESLEQKIQYEYADYGIELGEEAVRKAEERGMEFDEDSKSGFIDEFLLSISNERGYYELNWKKTYNQIFDELLEHFAKEEGIELKKEIPVEKKAKEVKPIEEEKPVKIRLREKGYTDEQIDKMSEKAKETNLQFSRDVVGEPEYKMVLNMTSDEFYRKLSRSKSLASSTDFMGKRIEIGEGQVPKILSDRDVADSFRKDVVKYAIKNDWKIPEHIKKEYPKLFKVKPPEVPLEKKIVKPELTQRQINMIAMLSKSYEKGNILFKDYNRLVTNVKKGFIITEEQVRRNLEKIIKAEVKPKPFAKLIKYRKDIKTIRAGFKAGEPGYRRPLFTGKAIDLEGLTPAERQAWIGEHSTYPFKGYERKEVLNIIGKALAGKGLTEKQTIYLEELIKKQRDSDLKRLLEQRWRKEVSRELKTEEEPLKTETISEIELEKGDKFKIKGEDYEVAKKTEEGVTLVNDKTIEVKDFGQVEIDKGSFEKGKEIKEPDWVVAFEKEISEIRKIESPEERIKRANEIEDKYKKPGRDRLGIESEAAKIRVEAKREIRKTEELKRPPTKAELEVPEEKEKRPYPTTSLFVTKDVKTGEKILKNEPVWYVPELKGLVKQKTFKKLFQQEQKTGKLFYEGEIEKFKVKKPKEEIKGQEKLFEGEPSEFVPSLEEPKIISKVVIDTFREFPKDIKKVGDDYWIEVMATAKELSTPYRYKALRRTILGGFAKERGVLLQDVRDALTATHEIGHNIDWILNKKYFPSSIKKRFPGTAASEKTLRSELKKISQILRPDLWEDPKRIKYLNSHIELMADFISHYIFEPEKTLKIAPNVTRAFESKLADNPDLFSAISRLQDKRYEEMEKPPIAEHILKTFPLPKKYDPLKLNIDLSDEGYVKTAENLGIQSARNYKALIRKAELQAKRIDELVPNKDRQTDLVVIAERGKRNPWTGKTRAEITEKGISENERKAINLFRAYQELARQTVNKYLRGADIAEYIKFIEDYFIHAYQTPLTQKYKSAISRWAKRSPQVKKRILPDLDTAVEIGLKPRVKTLSDGLRLWSGINYRVATNIAFLKTLPKIVNDDGVSVIQKPKDFPEWPVVDYHPIRQTYKIPLKYRGILLFQGQVAVDPRVKPFIDAMFGRRFLSSPVRLIEGFNAIAKAFELTLFSLFHHQAEFFSACGAFGARAMPYLGGYWGKKAELFGKSKILGIIPAHIKLLQAGKQLEDVPEFIDDYVKHGGQLGRITTEGINTMENMLIGMENYIKITVPPRKITTGGFPIWQPYAPFTTTRAVYSWTQRLLWDNVQRVKLLTYYKIVSDGCARMEYFQNKADRIREKNPAEAERIEKKIISAEKVKDVAAKYCNDNYGGQEWLNTVFKKSIVRQFFTQLLMSLDWTWSQIKTGGKVFAYAGKTAEERARMAFVRHVYRKHWFKWLTAVGATTIAGSYAINQYGPWDNEPGHKLDVDWTKIWRKLPWNSGLIFPSWKERGDYSRRYIGLGKAGRELHRWITDPLIAFGYKLSPGASMTFEQLTGHTPGSFYPEPWHSEDLEGYEQVYERFKGVMEKFRPFAFSGNNAFLAFPSRKGMTQYKAIRCYKDIYDAKAKIAEGGVNEIVTKLNRILKKDEDKLRKDIIEGCNANNVDYERADRYALSNVKTNFYGKFWWAARNLKANSCNRYADALIELGMTLEGFKRSFEARKEQISEKALEIAIEAMERAAYK